MFALGKSQDPSADTIEMLRQHDNAALAILRSKVARISNDAGHYQNNALRLLPLIDAEIAERTIRKPPARRKVTK